MGGFYRRTTESGKTVTDVLDPSSGSYVPLDTTLTVAFVEEVKDLNRRGRYAEGIAKFMDAEGEQADLARRVILGYVSYGLHRAAPGEVVEAYADVDRIMTAGFNWAPPSALADLIGLERITGLFDRYAIPCPPVITAARKGEVPRPLFNLPFVTPGRYLSG
jgi:hypothetical protein